MKTQHFDIFIQVPRQQVWATMLRSPTDEAGGEVMGEPVAIPGVGEYVSFVDTEGNRNSMIEPDMAPPACKT